MFPRAKHFESVDNQGHATQGMEVLERCQAYGSAEAVFAEKGAARAERRPTRAFMAGRGFCRAGRVQKLRCARTLNAGLKKPCKPLEQAENHEKDPRWSCARNHMGKPG